MVWCAGDASGALLQSQNGSLSHFEAGKLNPASKMGDKLPV